MAKKTGKVNVYDIVTERIIAQLDKGVIPWRKPWSEGNNKPVNWKTGKAYRGINTFLLESGEYATYKQVAEAGGQVKKGEHANIVVFWKFLDVKESKEVNASDDKEQEKKTIPFLRYYNVFNIETQVDGLTPKCKKEVKPNKPIECSEVVVNDYVTKEKIDIKSSHEASYSYTSDYINVPVIDSFDDSQSYYAVLFHEMVHSTGHKARLNRDIENSFGTELYSKEELVAELGSAFLCAECGIDNDKLIENSASYIASWKKVLKDNNKWAVSSGSKSQKAVEFILNKGDVKVD